MTDSAASDSKNRVYTEMLNAAKKRLSGRSPKDIAEKASVVFNEDTSRFLFNSLGTECCISYPEYENIKGFDNWAHLTALHYFELADSTPLSPDLITFGELPDGLIRGQGFDRQSEVTLGKFFGNREPLKVKKAFEALGATFIGSNADLCAVIPFLPLYPVTVKVWFKDDEFDGTGKMLLNKSARHYLLVEDAILAGGFILDTLVKRYEEMFPDDV